MCLIPVKSIDKVHCTGVGKKSMHKYIVSPGLYSKNFKWRSYFEKITSIKSKLRIDSAQKLC